MSRVRLNLELESSVRDRLETLQERSGAATMTEVIRRALAVYEVVLQASEDGERVVVQSREGKERQLVLL